MISTAVVLADGNDDDAEHRLDEVEAHYGVDRACCAPGGASGRSRRLRHSSQTANTSVTPAQGAVQRG